MRYAFLIACCGFAVLPLNNLTAALQHGITAALCLMGCLSYLSLLVHWVIELVTFHSLHFQFCILHFAFFILHLPLVTRHSPHCELTIHTLTFIIAIQLSRNRRYHEDDFEHT